jgi:hypothetical protein
VRDADPKHEIRDVNGPEDGWLVTGHTQADVDLMRPSIDTPAQTGQDHTQRDKVRCTWRPHRAEQVVTDLAKGEIG